MFIFLYSVYFTIKIKVKKKIESKMKTFRYMKIRVKLMPVLRFSLNEALKDALSKEVNDPRRRREE